MLAPMRSAASAATKSCSDSVTGSAAAACVCWCRRKRGGGGDRGGAAAGNDCGDAGKQERDIAHEHLQDQGVCLWSSHDRWPLPAAGCAVGVGCGKREWQAV